ncbi:RICIN domain-containing protein [Umezawaea endophytica]|uniref:RICIN domain-containing protein n=1 Tax=Umezawaea endophytica TaxID=1654476 RepID=A0A9X2VTR1_9PSEU|nr:RICIN domain-containing protein [Umezawaea endophytica]MCS7482479.1 RICIN domain-containing protein [Umezawaea endophytica]
MAEFGAALRELRGRKTQQNIADHAQRNHFYLHRPDLSAIERGHRLPTANELRAILHACDRADLVDEFIGLRERLVNPARASRPAWPWKWVAVAAAVVVVAAGVWFVATPGDTNAVYHRPVVIRHSDSDLRLAVVEDPGDRGAHVVSVESSSRELGMWRIGDPHKSDGNFFQVRALGRPSLCLEAFQESVAEQSYVVQWECLGREHQFWRFEQVSGGLRIVNMHSRLCLGAPGPEVRGGVRMVQRDCDEAQRWITVPE